MARASFTLRKSTTEQGSYLQYPIDDPAYTTRDDNDNYLRGDQLTLAPAAPVSDLMYIDAQVIDYDTVMLERFVRDHTRSNTGSVSGHYQLRVKRNAQVDQQG